MIRKLALPVLASLMATYAVLHVIRVDSGAQSPGTADKEPVRSPFGRTVAASGIVEAQTENIAIGSPLVGIVRQVFVCAGQKVNAGDTIFCLDDRHLIAELNWHEANLGMVSAQLARLEGQPRPEELPSAEARVREVQAELKFEQDRMERERFLFAKAAASKESFVGREQAFQIAVERLARVEADLRLLKAGAWHHDKAVARAAVGLALSQIQRTKTELDRLVVRSPLDGDILQVNIRPGEFVSIPPREPLVLLGNVHDLHVRVSIDEHEIPRFNSEAPARAMLRSVPHVQFALTFVRIEPYIIPKRSFTNDSTERVDIRILQVIYRIEPQGQTVYVGQQMDVFIAIDQ